MNDTERAGWLADKLHNGGDYGKEAAALLVKQAHEVERLRGIVPEVLERLNDELCAENERLRALLQALVNALNSGHSLTIFDALTGAEAALGPNAGAKLETTAAPK